MNNSTVAGQDEYKERYVVFLDLLGFKALVCARKATKTNIPACGTFLSD
jgi:hypothetical protein